MCAREFGFGAALVGHVEVGVEVRAAFDRHAAYFQHPARRLVALCGDRHRAEQRVKASLDGLLDRSRPIVAALGPEAHERFQLRRLTCEERVGQFQQRAVKAIAGDEAQIAVDQGEAAGKVVDGRLQRLRLLADRRDVGADRYEALDLAVTIEARDDDGFKANIGTALGPIAQLAAPSAAGVDRLPHLLEGLQRLPARAEHLVGLADELGFGVADDLAKAIVHLKQAAGGIRHGDAEVLFERLLVAGEPIGDLAGAALAGVRSGARLVRRPTQGGRQSAEPAAEVA